MTLARLVADEPRASDLTPRRRGVAVLANGGVVLDEAREVIGALVEGWPAVVLACPTGPERPRVDALVPVVLDAPATGPVIRGPRVVQRLRRRRTVAGPGVVLLPPVARATLDVLLDGRFPGPTRWMRSWSEVWRAGWV